VPEHISIHYADQEDLSEVAALLCAVNVATYTNVSDELTPQALLQHYTPARTVAKRLELADGLSSGARVYAAFDDLDDQIVGYSLPAPDWPGGMGVLPRFQPGCLGLNLALLTIKDTLATEDDLVFTVVPRTPALALYKRLGFLLTERDMSDHFFTLDGGQKLPQVEVVATLDARQAAVAKLTRLLKQRNRLMPVASAFDQ